MLQHFSGVLASDVVDECQMPYIRTQQGTHDPSAEKHHKYVKMTNREKWKQIEQN